MNDDHPEQDQDAPMLSPVRPQRPDAVTPPATPPKARSENRASAAHTSPKSALNMLRSKMEVVATEFSQGKINRAQFNAVYGRYSEQRAIIQRLVERNPDSQAWQQVVNSGAQTGFLRQHFEAHPQCFAVFRHHITTPLITGGKSQQIDLFMPVLSMLWKMPQRPKTGLARKPMDNGQWLVLSLGEYAVTVVLYLLEPSVSQATLVRDMHADFERANVLLLGRETARLDKMVFPQRALVDETF